MCWETPQSIFDSLNDEFNFTLDPCCLPDTAKCKKYFTPIENGLKQSWSNENVFVNPPYGREIKNWVEKCSKEKTLSVMLIPARTDTKWFHEYIYNKPNVEVRFMKGRIKFLQDKIEKDAAPFPTMIVIFKNK